MAAVQHNRRRRRRRVDDNGRTGRKGEEKTKENNIGGEKKGARRAALKTGSWASAWAAAATWGDRGGGSEARCVCGECGRSGFWREIGIRSPR